MKINTDSLFMVNCSMQDQCLLNTGSQPILICICTLCYTTIWQTKYAVYVFVHWAKVICNKKSPCCNLPTVEVLSWQWPQHQMSCCQLTPAKSQTITRQLTMASVFSIIQNTLSKISKVISKNYIKTVCTAPRKICGYVHPMTLKTPRCGNMLDTFVSPLGSGWMSTTITSGYKNWKSLQWWNTALTSVYNFKARHPHCVFLH